MKTNEIKSSNVSEKKEAFQKFSKEVSDRAQEIALNESKWIFAKNAADESTLHSRKCQQADCEYTAYIECMSAEEYANLVFAHR